MRCDYALLANLALSAVSITSGSPVNSSAAASAITAGVALANAGTSSCSAARRALAGAGARALQTAAATLPFATFSLLIGASTSEAGAAAIAAAVQSPTATFPNTLQAWAPTWSLTSVTWTAAGFGSAVTTSNDATIAHSASFSPVPVLSPQQQLGLGLGIGLPLVFIVVTVAVCACYMNSRAAARAANRLTVVAPPAK